MSDLPTLHALYSAHHGKISDKWSSYLSLYHREFEVHRTRTKSLLEIGIQNGGSLELWAKYFPHIELIVGCDINPKCGLLHYADPRIKLILGDATATSVQQAVLACSPTFDIVIDDGSHLPREVVLAFLRYWPQVSPGGVFVAEDLHCDYFPSHQGGIRTRLTANRFFGELVHIVNHEHWQGVMTIPALLAAFEIPNEFDLNGLSETIASISFHNSVAIIRKALSPMDTRLGHRIIVGEVALADERVLLLRGDVDANSLQGFHEKPLQPAVTPVMPATFAGMFSR